MTKATINTIFENIGKNLIFKHQTKEDKEFLLSLYASTREDELSITSMSLAEKKAFIKQQFEAKEGYYAAKFSDAQFLIISRKKQQIGRLIYAIDDSLHLIDIAIVKKSRDSGFGSEILHALIHNSKILNKPLRLSVAIDNIKAIKLYQRLGLTMIDQHNYYYKMIKI
ncbi:MAG: hypothetical protein KU38_00660 [Sulfurovum sp. FS08-3]|nr:MAG: hypothetical protein KU38_00660 [Sulfurovum sp. FS08-3]